MFLFFFPPLPSKSTGPKSFARTLTLQTGPAAEELLSDLRRRSSFNSPHGWSFQDGRATSAGCNSSSAAKVAGTESRTARTELMISGQEPRADPQSVSAIRRGIQEMNLEVKPRGRLYDVMKRIHRYFQTPDFPDVKNQQKSGKQHECLSFLKTKITLNKFKTSIKIK